MADILRMTMNSSLRDWLDSREMHTEMSGVIGPNIETIFSYLDRLGGRRK